MGGKGCRCADQDFGAEFDHAAVVNLSADRHARARLPGILKYRGLDDEAKLATRLAKIENLISSMQAALNDLEGTLVSVLAVEACAGPGKRR